MRKLEQVINETYQNLSLFVRDLTLEKKIQEKYQKGIILTEPSFIDMTYKIGGMNKDHNTRFVLLSSRASDMRELEEDTSWGLFVLHTHSYFKVLDTFLIHGKTIIILLHIKEEDVPLFQEMDISIDTNLVNQIKQQMEEVITTPPLLELDNDIWERRVNFPIGIKDDGTFFKEKEEYVK